MTISKRYILIAITKFAILGFLTSTVIAWTVAMTLPAKLFFAGAQCYAHPGPAIVWACSSSFASEAIIPVSAGLKRSYVVTEQPPLSWWDRISDWSTMRKGSSKITEAELGFGWPWISWRVTLDATRTYWVEFGEKRVYHMTMKAKRLPGVGASQHGSDMEGENPSALHRVTLPLQPVTCGLIGSTAINGSFAFIGVWLIRKARAVYRVRCALCERCGYDISSIRGMLCPECGAPIVRAGRSSNTC